MTDAPAGMDVDEQPEPAVSSNANENNSNDTSNNNNNNAAADEEPAGNASTSVQEQRKQMKKIANKVQVVGDTWYPISKKWHDSWRGYTMFKKADSDIPGGIENMHLREELVRPEPIDNTDLQAADNENALKKEIQEYLTHVWIHETEWQLLHSWYGGGPSFPRKVYERGVYNKQKYICIHPKLVKLVKSNAEGAIDATTEEVKGFPPSFSLKQIATDIEDECFQDQKKKSDDDVPFVHIWMQLGYVKSMYPIRARKVEVTKEDIEGEDEERWVEVPDDYLKTKLEDIDLKANTRILVEHMNEDGSWPRAKPEAEWTQFQIGDIVDVKDDNKKWYECCIRRVDRPQKSTDDEETAGGEATAATDAAPATDADASVTDSTAPATTAEEREAAAAAAADPDTRMADSNAQAPEAAADAGAEANADGGGEAAAAEPSNEVQSKAELEAANAKRTKIVIHYIGWNTKWDEAVFADDENRVAPRHAHSTAPHRPPKKRSDKYSRGGGGYGSSYGGYTNSFTFHQHDQGRPETRGIVGLRNLGNTCFMNSTIQCLAQSPWLTDYFLENEYIHHVNKKNPLGWGGRVATAWARLLHDMFSNKYRVIAPRAFKDAVGEVAPRFLGYAQQDSQELLSFLLDGIHEDLNQIETKPTTNSIDSAGRDDSIVALESWKQYLRRNQSVVVDLMQGQYRSEVVCPDCKRISVTFDPYMFLSIPLPTERHKMIEYTFIPADTSVLPKVYAQKMLKVADIDMLKQAISSTHTIPKEEIFICDIWKSKIHRELRKHDAVGDINRISDDIFVYHSPRPTVDPQVLADYEAKVAAEANPDADADAEDADTANNNNSNVRSDAYKKDYYKYVGEDGGVAGAGYRYHYSGKKKGVREPPDFQTFVVIHQHRVATKHIYYANQNRYEDESIGYPVLVTLSNKLPVTVNQIRQRIWDIISPFIEDDTKKFTDEELPFRFWATWGFNDHGELKPSDEVFDLRRRNLKFIVHWSDFSQFKSQLYDRSKRDRDASAAASGGSARANDDRRQQRSKPIDLQQCIEAFAEKEVLSENDAWYCSQCKGFKCASKKIDLFNSPDLLIIHLKRFSYTRSWRDRINTLVKFPLEGLDLSNYLLDPAAKGDAIYDCYAVSNHMGGMGGGHYTAYARSLESNEWFQLDDSRASRVHNVEHVCSTASYVIYYKKRQPRKLKHRASRIFLPDIPAATATATDVTEATDNNNNNNNNTNDENNDNSNNNENTDENTNEDANEDAAGN